MIKAVIHDPIFLARPSTPAERSDVSVADDLMDTLKANAEHCVGMAANMIGELKCIIVFNDNGVYSEMLNPEIIARSGRYEAEEGCLSITGQRKCVRYKTVKIRWQTREFQTRVKNFSGYTAEIIQHEVDHCSGLLI